MYRLAISLFVIASLTTGCLEPGMDQPADSGSTPSDASSAQRVGLSIRVVTSPKTMSNVAVAVCPSGEMAIGGACNCNGAPLRPDPDNAIRRSGSDGSMEGYDRFACLCQNGGGEVYAKALCVPGYISAYQ